MTDLRRPRDLPRPPSCGHLRVRAPTGGGGNVKTGPGRSRRLGLGPNSRRTSPRAVSVPQIRHTLREQPPPKRASPRWPRSAPRPALPTLWLPHGRRNRAQGGGSGSEDPAEFGVRGFPPPPPRGNSPTPKPAPPRCKPASSGGLAWGAGRRSPAMGAGSRHGNGAGRRPAGGWAGTEPPGPPRPRFDVSPAAGRRSTAHRWDPGSGPALQHQPSRGRQKPSRASRVPQRARWGAAGTRAGRGWGRRGRVAGLMRRIA